MHGGELLFVEQIARSPERVTEEDIALAKVFVVPTLLIFGFDHGDEVRWRPTDDTCSGKRFKEMQTATANALLASPYFQRSGGADHLLVADSYKLWDMERNSDFSLEFLKAIENMTVGHFETAEQLAWQRAWRCTITVPYVHKPPLQLRRSTLSVTATRFRDLAPRDFGVFFMGKVGPDPGYATRRRIATMLGELRDLPMTYVSTSAPRALGFEAECDLRACLEAARCVGCSWNASAPGRLYEHRLQRSEFSLVIRGDTPSSARLYDALAYGVIPIIVSNDLWAIGLPFPGRVPWQDLVFMLPEAFTAADLRIIAVAPRDMKDRKRKAIRAHLQDVSWTAPGSRVADNVVSEAARYCM
ncbi:hypothetical protein WJX81_000717 [Elliptochloris bilobata]|uniref:Exostosin GT47 domain-containing protein n=1 Tax=Elliptochloris bilobata TaxID=381761 RepID=A0AAW1RME9_9CHLO